MFVIQGNRTKVGKKQETETVVEIEWRKLVVVVVVVVVQQREKRVIDPYYV